VLDAKELAMTGTRRTFSERARWRAELPGVPWREAFGALPILAALALWACVLAGVLAPLSGALARLDAPARGAPAAAPCGAPPDALASAAIAGSRATCR
jgi:hypothetical protein